MDHYINFWKTRTNLHHEDEFYSRLLKFKFTNAYRIQDRNSQISYQQVMMNPNLSQDIEELLLRVFIHVHFHNGQKAADKIKEYQPTVKSYDLNSFYEYLSSDKQGLWSSAYSILPLSGDTNKLLSVCRKFDFLVRGIKENQISFKTSNSLYRSLLNLPGVGDFIASQVVFNMTWVIPDYHLKPLYALGVGAKRGAWKLGLDSKNPELVLDTMLDIWSDQLSDCQLNLDGRVPPSTADVQNTLCEFDKASRVLDKGNTKKGFPQSTKLKPYKGGKQSFNTVYPNFWYF